jgi:outer membrane lipase/esterase
MIGGRSCPCWGSVVGGVPIVVVGALLAGAVVGQPLGQALSEQLGGQDCGRLVSPDDPSEVLIGPLQAICTQGFLSPIPTSPLVGADTSLAGNASAQQQRLLREVRPESQLIAATGQGASADSWEPFASFRLFAAVGREWLDRDETPFEAGYESSADRLVGGLGYTFSPAWEAGGGVEYLHQDGDYQAGGDLKTTSYGLFAFLTGALGTKLSATVIGEYMHVDLDRTQVVDFPAGDIQVCCLIRADYTGNALRLGALVSYREVRGRVVLDPFAAIDWARVDYESYSQQGETGVELRFDRERQTSLISTLGLSVALWLPYRTIVVVPAVRAAWKHEFEGDQRRVAVSFVHDRRAKRFSFETQPPDRDFGELSASATTLLPGGMAPYALVQTLVGHSFFDSMSASIGISYAF